jgi:hypothetical protein
VDIDFATGAPVTGNLDVAWDHGTHRGSERPDPKTDWLSDHRRDNYFIIYNGPCRLGMLRLLARGFWGRATSRR